MDTRDVSSMDQLKVRYKRCHEQIATIRDLLLKTSTSLELLETDNNFLREQNKVLLQTKIAKMKKEDKDINKTPSKMRGPSAAKGHVELSLTTLGRVQEKLSEFEKGALSLRTALEEAKEYGRKTKAKLEEMQRNYYQERKRNGQLEEMKILMEDQSQRDASSRIVAKRRLNQLIKEIHGLTQGLSAYKCTGSSQMDNNLQEMRSLSPKSSTRVEVVSSPIKSGTPDKTVDGTYTALSLDDTPKQSRLAFRWDFLYYYQQGFPEPATPQEDIKETGNMWRTIYLSLGSIATVYFIYASVSYMPTCMLNTFF